MKIIIKILLLVCIVNFFQQQIVQKLEDLGVQMMMLGNQPHRGLGILYLVHVMQPHRLDYSKNYYSFWLQSQIGSTMLEGSKKPLIANEIIQTYHQNQNDLEMRQLASVAFRMEANRRWKKEKK